MSYIAGMFEHSGIRTSCIIRTLHCDASLYIFQPLKSGPTRVCTCIVMSLIGWVPAIISKSSKQVYFSQSQSTSLSGLLKPSKCGHCVLGEKSVLDTVYYVLSF